MNIWLRRYCLSFRVKLGWVVGGGGGGGLALVYENTPVCPSLASHDLGRYD